MEVTWDQIAIIALGAAAILVLVVLLVLRHSKTVQPVYCIHCWVHEQKVTIVSYTDREDRWAICPGCVKLYWKFEDSNPSSPEEASH